MPDRVINSAIYNPERLQALQSMNLLDTPPEETFDRVTRLAAKLLDVPVALMDGDRMFFKSIVVEAPLTPIQADGPRNPSDSLVKYPVAFQEPFLVEDARSDPRTKDNDAVQSIGIVAFAAVPLTDGHGHALGALCALDDKPHVWTPKQIDILQDFGGIIEAIIHSRAAALERIQPQPALSRSDGADGAGRPKLDGIDRTIHITEKYLSRISELDHRIMLGKPGAVDEGLRLHGELEEAVQATRRELMEALKELQGVADGDGEVQSAHKLLWACETYCNTRQRCSEADKLFQQQQATLDELRVASQAVIAAEQGLRRASREYSLHRE